MSCTLDNTLADCEVRIQYVHTIYLNLEEPLLTA
jgi:hypothetical protein